MAATGSRQGEGDHQAPIFGRSESGTYLVDFVAIPGGALGLRASLCGIARSAYTSFPPSGLGPRASSAAAGMPGRDAVVKARG